MSRLKRLWSNLRGSFWFVPSLIVAGSMVLAVALIDADSAASRTWLARWPRLFGAGAAGARGMLSTIAGSMMTVVGVTFSMTLVTLALASSQYTSRILRNFMRDRVTQVVLGIFAGIFTYCLIVLRTIRSGDESAFIPSLAVSFGVVLAIGGIGALIFFIHHIASSIQASNIIASVAHETIVAADRDHRTRGVPHNVLSRAADKGPLEAAASFCRQDNQIDVVFLRESEDLIRRFTGQDRILSAETGWQRLLRQLRETFEREHPLVDLFIFINLARLRKDMDEMDSGHEFLG